MPGLDSLAKILMLLGGSIFALGLVMLLLGRIPFLGRLPGDILVNKGNFTFYFPLVTFLVLSLVLTILLNIVLRLFRG